ncbi:DUF6694 family lipoprotein [Kordiimonas aestuarii]|uniref:DUF6694 family lipoprotein n=1 Tax=Kordiimonas aestuarii TaxID=1005925 RepID=UPI0021CF276B|nr:DUF6694 family lipoprotein [Kordiimonas aestuarii]
MNTLIKITAISAALALAACGDNKDEKKADDMPPPEAPATGEMSPADTMEQVAEALTLDTSSLEAFKESIANMKASLSSEDRARLTAALGDLATKATGGQDMDSMDKGKNLMKNMGDGKSVTEVLYENMADELDGRTFDDILEMADE